MWLGWLSSFANTYFHDMIQAIAPNSAFWNQYESAIAAPLFEEPFKLLPIFFVLYLFSVRRIKSIFLLAIASGLGFQIVEDFAYIRQDLPGGFSYTVSGILGRVANAPMSHWVYTGLVMLGLLLLAQVRKGRKDLLVPAWGYFIAGFALHFVGNSPFSQIVTELPIAIPLLPSLSDGGEARARKINQKNAYGSNTYAFLLLTETELAEELGNELIWCSVPCDFSEDFPGAGEVDLKQVNRHT